MSARLVAAVRDKWRWRELTAVQKAAIPAVLGQQRTLVLGPTAGGKTEAAMLPLLDRWQLEGWGADRPSILCLSPLKALLNDQLDRWQRATALVGASAFTWHGDVTSDEKRAFRADPAYVLLSTPESLELLLSNGDDRRRLAGVRAVVIDEAHAFVGDPRGAQVHKPAGATRGRPPTRTSSGSHCQRRCRTETPLSHGFEVGACARPGPSTVVGPRSARW